MRNPLSERTVSLKPSGIRKFFDVVSEMPDAISLGVGEPDFDTPWHIRDEGIYSLEKGRTFYTSNSGLMELRREICKYMDRKYGLKYEPVKQVLITVGGSEAIDIAFRAMINPGDEIIIPQPSYVSYEPCAILANATPVIINLKDENDNRESNQGVVSVLEDLRLDMIRIEKEKHKIIARFMVLIVVLVIIFLVVLCCANWRSLDDSNESMVIEYLNEKGG